MRLDNSVLVPQHEQPGLLFWSASLVRNNEKRARWHHAGNRPHFGLRIGHVEGVCMCVFCVCVCPSLPATSLSVPLAVSPGTKGQRSHALFANGCSALFKNPFTVSWRLTQSASSQPCTPPTKQQSGNATLAP